MIRAMTLHPGDETLSRLTDLSDAERMRSRAGRHAARCPRCAALIGEYRALGDAARALPRSLPSAALRARVAAGVEPAHPPMPPVAGPVDRPSRDVAVTGRGKPAPHRAVLATAIAAAVVTAVVLAWPAVRRRELAAADAQRLTVLPRYPRAGSTVRARFVPPAGMPAADTLWLEGEFGLRDPGSGDPRDVAPIGVPLLRAGEAYVGTLAVPGDALAASLRVVHTHWPPMRERVIGRDVLLTSGASPDRPSIDALEAGVARASFGGGRGLLAAEFARWAPEHPLRWVLEPERSSGGAFDWLGYFTSKERRFARLTRQLRDRRSLRAGELAGMAKLAYEIEEPGAAAEWTARLQREHPESAWTLDALVDELHAMELRGAPRDSIRALIPTLDALVAPARATPADPWTLQGVVERNGDPRMVRDWRRYMARVGLGVRAMDLLGRREELRDAEVRDIVEAAARRSLTELTGVRGPGAARTRAFTYGELASVALSRGEYRRAIALTDSTHVGACTWVGEDTRALAYLALGDSASAERHLLRYAKGEWAGADSVRRLLGARARSASWARAVDSAWRDANACRAREQGKR